jgi:replicative superfamily II helicase
VQDGPLICLQLLNNAFLENADSLARWQNCQLIEADFRPFLVERAKKAAEKASRKSPRRAFTKPSLHSNLTLGPPLRQN